MKTAIIIYLIGYVSTYYTIRWQAKKVSPDWNWRDVRFASSISFFSWVAFIATLASIIQIPKIKLPKNPPKWL